MRIIVPFGAGSTPDIVARLVADDLQRKYPTSSFVVENKPGASGNLGTDAVAKAAPDGSTIGVRIGGPLAINTLLFAKLPYEGVNSVAELVSLLKNNPGKYNFASIGNGSLSHLAMEAIAIKAGTQLVHVPYVSSPQAVTAVIRNDTQMACLPAIAVTPQAKTGAVKILAVSTATARLTCRTFQLSRRPASTWKRCLEWPDRVGGHAEIGRREDQQGCFRDHQAGGHARKACHPIDGAGRLLARRIAREWTAKLPDGRRSSRPRM